MKIQKKNREQIAQNTNKKESKMKITEQEEQAPSILALRRI